MNKAACLALGIPFTDETVIDDLDDDQQLAYNELIGYMERTGELDAEAALATMTSEPSEAPISGDSTSQLSDDDILAALGVGPGQATDRSGATQAALQDGYAGGYLKAALTLAQQKEGEIQFSRDYGAYKDSLLTSPENPVLPEDPEAARIIISVAAKDADLLPFITSAGASVGNPRSMGLGRVIQAQRQLSGAKSSRQNLLLQGGK